jgi:phosphoribosylanthranilate isomerase
MTNVKICGITNFEDARMAVEAGADLLGFNFYEPSPRYVSPEQVQAITAGLLALNKPKPTLVGVFVNMPTEAVSQILDFCRLDAAQLHGDESPEAVAHFKGRAYKVLRPKSREEADRLIPNYTTSLAVTQNRPDQPPTWLGTTLPSFLLDAYHPTLYGGTGQVADWRLAADIARQHAIMLAGSLTPNNVGQAIQAVRPWGVDVSSGVEAEKGKKDHEKMRAFVRAVKDTKLSHRLFKRSQR